MKKILVTGATGMLGRRVVPLLLKDGHDVTAVGRSPERLSALAHLGAATLTVSLFDAAAVRHVVEGHEIIVNLATHVPPGMRAFLPRAWKEMDRVRRDGSANIADAAIAMGVQRVVQESFAPIYPDCGARWIDESVQPRPAAYNRTTLDAEASAHRVTAAGRVGVALRFAFLYGGVEDSFTRDVLRYARRGWLALFGRPDAYVPMVTHDDAARAVLAALEAPAGVYNVVDDEPLTRRAFADVLGNALNTRTPKLPPRWMASLAGSIGETMSRSLRISNQALRAATGWRPEFPSGREGWHAAADQRNEMEAA